MWAPVVGKLARPFTACAIGATQACNEFGFFGWTAAGPVGQSGSSPIRFALACLCEFFSRRA